MEKFSFYFKDDNKKERISTVKSSTRLTAAKYFAKMKRMELKTFLSIFKVSR